MGLGEEGGSLVDSAWLGEEGLSEGRNGKVMNPMGSIFLGTMKLLVLP